MTVPSQGYIKQRRTFTRQEIKFIIVNSEIWNKNTADAWRMIGQGFVLEQIRTQMTLLAEIKNILSYKAN